MFTFSSVLKCVCVIYILKETTPVLARRKSPGPKFKVDEFIDKLLASKKFDVLAEKLAEKAVERMMSLKPNLRFAKEFKQVDIPRQNIPFKNVSHKTEVHFEETPSPLRNLSLKFKYFTKGAFYEIESDEKEDSEVKEIQKPEAKNSTGENQTYKAHHDEDDDDESIDLSDIESSLQENTENTSVQTKKVKVDKKSNQNKTETHAIEKDGSLSMENKKNAELSENDLPLSENPKTNFTHSNEASDFEKHVKKDRVLFSKESKATTDIKEPAKPRRKRLHREGNRVYTFQSSSDYDDYHEELKRVERQRVVFV